LRAAPASDLRERAYQIFGADFLDNLLEVNGGQTQIARVTGFISAPRDRRTSRDAQYLFVNGRFVRDRLISRALSEGYRSVLPHGVYPAALLFIDIPLEEVDVNVHPAKTEVRFRRAAAVTDAVREAVRSALASAGFVRAEALPEEPPAPGQIPGQTDSDRSVNSMSAAASQSSVNTLTVGNFSSLTNTQTTAGETQPRIDFADSAIADEDLLLDQVNEVEQSKPNTVRDLDAMMRDEAAQTVSPDVPIEIEVAGDDSLDCGGLTPLSQATPHSQLSPPKALSSQRTPNTLPPLASADRFAREVSVESLSTNIRPLGQLDESFIIATDDEGLLLIDQHVAHERILFDKYRALESARTAESQQLLIPETFDLTPAQAAVFDTVAAELESYGFELMRLSGRTVAIKAAPADLPAGEGRNMLAEILETVDAEKKGTARETLRDDIAASLACHAAIKVNMPLTPEKMRWLIDRLLKTSSPTTCPHGRPVILRLATRDILKGFHRI